MSSLKVDIVNGKAVLAGYLDENSDLNTLASASGAISINFKEVSRVNSCGVREWVNLLGPTHVMVGFGINTSLPNYMTQAQAIDAWTRVEAAHPTIRGGFDWETGSDEAQGWPFANGVAPLIRN